jgi:hypothetical protein
VVIERFARFDWPLESLLQAVQQPVTLEFIIRSCIQTDEGRYILKNLKRLVTSKNIVVPQWQAEALLRRRRKRWFRLH